MKVRQVVGSWLIVLLLHFVFSGKDYACDVHVISVDKGSPAERAGIKAGDAIVEVSISQILSRSFSSL